MNGKDEGRVSRMADFCGGMLVELLQIKHKVGLKREAVDEGEVEDLRGLLMEAALVCDEILEQG